jgi:hypothetical protein
VVGYLFIFTSCKSFSASSGRHSLGFPFFILPCRALSKII